MAKKWHHCGTCACCGGEIPCGETHRRRWRADGECQGYVREDGLRGAEQLEDDEIGECNND